MTKKARSDDDLLTDEEAAEILKVSARTVQRLRLTNKIKSVRVTAKLTRIKQEHIREYIAQRAAA